MLRKVQNFVKTKSSVGVQKRKRSTILESALESKAASTPDHQCVGALPSLMEWYQKHSCSLCWLLLLRKSFGLGRIRKGDLELISSGSQLKTRMCKRFVRELTWCHYYSSILCSTYRTYAASVWWKLICMNSNFEDFCGHLVASQIFLAHQHQADGKLTFYGRNDWISSCFELLNRHFLPPWT